LFPDSPEYASPYSPASRLLLNILNISVPWAASRLNCTDLIASDEIQQRVNSCRVQSLVDYTGVAALKLDILGQLFEAFDRTAESDIGQGFAYFRRERGEVLERHCLFLALREHFGGQLSPETDWHRWPDAFRDPSSPAVAGFAAQHRRRVDFFVWTQWIADEQLGAAATAAQQRGMGVGLYRDLAVGADRAGGETWANRAVVVSGAQVGAPPDIHNPAGQDWGLPPFHPRALWEEAYQSFIELVRANMRHAGGLRIDHVMALQQLYWVPQGQKPDAGAYVRYKLSDLVGILALESHRHRCLIVGEDLGTVPEGFRDAMTAANILSYRVLYFEQDASGNFLPPSDYPPLAVAVVGNHDLPTLRGWWENRDIALKERLGLYPAAGEEERQRVTRQHDKEALLTALRGAALLPDDETEPDVPILSRASHAYLARAASAIVMVQIDDLTDEAEPVNVPATSDEHPNWRRRLSMTLEELANRLRFIDIAEIFRAERE
jgi:4-alpha-glucanotransferase